MQLAQTIRHYYFAHLQALPPETQFHWCTRLAAWEGNPQAYALLTELRSHIVPSPPTEEKLREMLGELISQPAATPVNAEVLRRPYFNAYPWLQGLEKAFFRVRHLAAVYGIDARPALFAHIPPSKLLTHKEELLADPHAVRFLSTYAVNYLYLLERVLLEHAEPTAIDIPFFYELGKGYDQHNLNQLQLCAYLYTHCIIAESNFYTRCLPPSLLEPYTAMLLRLEALMQTRFTDFSLDTKLEFLVCCRICRYETNLEAKIYDECAHSVYPTQSFLIDTHNLFATHTDKQTLAASEHRNVLFVMSTQPYRPHSTLI